jgi:hypothetical protein
MKKTLLLIALVCAGQAFAECPNRIGKCLSKTKKEIPGDWTINYHSPGWNPMECVPMQDFAGKSVKVVKQACINAGGVALEVPEAGISFGEGVKGFAEEAPKVADKLEKTLNILTGNAPKSATVEEIKKGLAASDIKLAEAIKQREASKVTPSLDKSNYGKSNEV